MGSTCKSSKRPTNWGPDYFLVGNLVLVPTNAAIPNRFSNSAFLDKGKIEFTIKKEKLHPLHPKLNLLTVLLSEAQSAIDWE